MLYFSPIDGLNGRRDDSLLPFGLPLVAETGGLDTSNGLCILAPQIWIFL